MKPRKGRSVKWLKWLLTMFVSWTKGVQALLPELLLPPLARSMTSGKI
jgi:hypothetical protein